MFQNFLLWDSVSIFDRLFACFKWYFWFPHSKFVDLSFLYIFCSYCFVGCFFIAILMFSRSLSIIEALGYSRRYLASLCWYNLRILSSCNRYILYTNSFANLLLLLRCFHLLNRLIRDVTRKWSYPMSLPRKILISCTKFLVFSWLLYSQ